MKNKGNDSGAVREKASIELYMTPPRGEGDYGIVYRGEKTENADENGRSLK